MDPLERFLDSVADDPRITTAHISVYLALWKKWKDGGCMEPLTFFRREVADVCKVSSANTYHRVIRELDSYGYISYYPSFNHNLGSEVYFAVGVRCQR